jgi:hypothetical protein
MKRSPLIASALVSTGLFFMTAAEPANAIPSQCDAIAGNLVANCEFETGALTGWTPSGNLANTGVTNNAAYVHSGTYGLQEGPVSADGIISQTLSTVPGVVYSVSAWYFPRDPAFPRKFDILWNGDTRIDVLDFSATGFNQSELCTLQT